MRNRRLERKQIGKGELLLVNNKSPLRWEEEPDLVSVPGGETPVFLARQAAIMFERLLSETDQAGEIVAVSGYRSKEEQRKLYEESLRENGEEFTRQYVALPGCSEHETGLAVDVGIRMPQIDFIRPEFPEEGVGRRFRNKAAAHGFILRYGEDKREITGIAGEPWHFRYVGYPHSCYITEKELCLEEYHRFLKTTASRRSPLLIHDGKNQITIWYEECREEELSLSLEEGCACQISGDNLAGFFITQWRGRV